MMSDFWSEKQVLVTGAGGFIGSHLVEALLARGARVRAFVRYNSRADAGLLRYVPQEKNAGDDDREIVEDDLTTAYYREGSLDLIEMLREQFQLALPMKPLCSDACRGLCPECGANLNRTECGHQPKWEDPRLAPLKGMLRKE